MSDESNSEILGLSSVCTERLSERDRECLQPSVKTVEAQWC